jgi:release factor glutamine methyltransferase
MTLEELRQDPRVRAADWTVREWSQVVEAICGLSHMDQLLSPQSAISNSQVEQVLALAVRAQDGEPLGYLLGWTYFDALRLMLTPDVLIPRPDTEVLLHAALAQMQSTNAQSVLDLCTGSGALALALKARCPGLSVTGADISAKAIDVARANGDHLSLSVHWVVTDLFDGLGQFDLIICNPPYIDPNDDRVEPSVRDYEPALALFAETEGLAVIVRILEQASRHLRSTGVLLLEHGPEQHGRIATAARKLDWDVLGCVPDLAGRDRVTMMRGVHAVDDR